MFYQKITSLIVLSVVFNGTKPFKSINLASFQWYLENEKLNLSLPTEVPLSATQKGLSVHTTLLKYGVIDDPYNGFNDVNLSWISDELWTFKTVFKCMC